MLLIFFQTNSFGQWVILPTDSIPLEGSTVYFIDNNIGFLTNGSQIFKSKDGGYHWNKIYKAKCDSVNHTFEYYGINSFLFTTNTTGFAVEGYKILKTKDQGITWDSINIPAFQRLGAGSVWSLWNKIYFIDSLTGFIVGGEFNPYLYTNPDLSASYYEVILKTDDGGENWRVLKYNNSNPPIKDIKGYKNSDIFYTIGGGLFPPIPYGDQGIFRIYEYTNRGDTSYDITPSQLKNSFAGTPVNISCPNHNHSIFSYYRFLLHYKNGMLLYDTLSFYPICMHFFNDQKGLIIDRDGDLYGTTDSCKTWKKMDKVTNQKLISIFFVNDTLGFMTTDSGQILKTTNSGGWIVGIENKNISKSEIKIYPNPTNNYINIETTNIQANKLEIIDVNERILFSKILNDKNREQVDISNFSQGIYFVRISGKDFNEVEKIIKY